MKNELINFAKKLYEKGLSPSVSGNISVLDIDNNILITSSGSAAGDLTRDDIVKINFDGNLIDGNKKPSSEFLMHIKIYKKRSDIKAVIHSHSPEITAFAVNQMPINEPILPEFIYNFNNGVPLAKYFLPSSGELADEVSSYFERNNAVLMANHGITVGGKSLKEAFYALEMIQSYCKTYIAAQVFANPKPLNFKQVSEVLNLNNHA